MKEERKSNLMEGEGFTKAVCLGRAGKASAIDGTPP